MKQLVNVSSMPWLPAIDSSWDVVRADHFLSVKKTVVGEKWPDYTLLSLTKEGVVIRDFTDRQGKLPETFDSYQEVQIGDLVMCLFDMDETPRTVGISSHRGMITGAYTTFQFDQTIVVPSYFEYLFISIDDRKAFKAAYSGLRKTIRPPVFLSLRFPLPPLETQQRISDYLDRETAEIDAAVADLDRYVELLEKRRRAKITFAVEGKSNLVKDNSTESHPVANLGLVAHAYQPETLSMEALNQSGTFPVFGANGIIGRHDNFNHEQPQVVIACRGNTCGAVNWTLPKSWINGNAMVINPHAEKLRKDFLFYVLEIADYSLVITGSAQPQIIRESLYRLRVPLPPLETQRRIADYLDRETTEIDSLIADSTRLRDLLLKRRSVLITEVVTGRKQV